MNRAPIQVLAQLAAQAPLVLAYLAGVLIPLFTWSRARLPSALTLSASLMMFGAWLVQVVAQQRIVHAAATNGWDAERTSTVFAGLAFLLAMVRATAFALLVCAALVGRRRVEAAV